MHHPRSIGTALDTLDPYSWQPKQQCRTVRHSPWFLPSPECFATLRLQKAKGLLLQRHAHESEITTARLNFKSHEWREKIAIIWSELQQIRVIDLDGKPINFDRLRIIFNVSFDRGGRIYALGDSWQNMSSDDRLNLRWKINGVYHPVVEIDYSCLHLFMAYAEAGQKPPSSDLYEIDGFDREQVKKAVLILLNAKNKSEAFGAIINQIKLYPSDVDLLISAIKKKHKTIRSVFHSDAGARFQKKDGQMALDIMLTMIQRTGVPPLSVHDSFIVPDTYEDTLYEVMRVVAMDHGLNGIELKTSNTTTLPIPPSLFHTCRDILVTCLFLTP